MIFGTDQEHGTIPVATYLSPTLKELNPTLMDWYYSNMTTNDELLCGPAGVQYIHIKYFNDGLFPAWCKLTSVNGAMMLDSILPESRIAQTRVPSSTLI